MGENENIGEKEDFEGTGETTTTALALSPPGDEDAAAIVRSHVLWAMGAGLVPIPLADIAGVTAIQMDALKKLAAHYGVDYSEATGKSLVAGLVGSSVARAGASIIKTIPIIGSVVGGISMSAMSGASTYALCQVAINHFVTHGNFLEVDLNDAKSVYKKALEKGKDVVDSLTEDADKNKDIYEALNHLEANRASGAISEEDYEKEKTELLAKISAENTEPKSDE